MLTPISFGGAYIGPKLVAFEAQVAEIGTVEQREIMSVLRQASIYVYFSCLKYRQHRVEIATSIDTL